MARALKASIAGAVASMMPKKLRGGVLLTNPFFGACYALFISPTSFLKSFFPNGEKGQAYKEWRMSPGTVVIGLWKKEYTRANYKINVEIDEKNGLPYVVHRGKRLYFRRNGQPERRLSALEIAESAYRSLLREQDERSAHRYVRSYEELKGKVLLDVGAAEAIFALDTIEYVNHAYLFECEEEWIEALEATFEPWKEKVTIVRKYVSDADNENNVTLDAFFKDKPSENLFLKMDIEGYEQKALKGAEGLLKGAKAICGSVCLYHRHDDEEAITRLLSSCGLKADVQPGYVFFGGEVRHGIVRFCR